MKKRCFATVYANGCVVYSDADSSQEHFNAVQYQGLPEDIQEQARKKWRGVEDINVTHLVFSNAFEASTYCLKRGFIIL